MRGISSVYFSGKELGERGSSDNLPRKAVTFHYSREERLKKLRHHPETRPRFPFFGGKKRRIRGILIIFIDLVLIYVVFYFANKPDNLYLRELRKGVSYELNVTGIKGKKVMIGFTVKNEHPEALTFPESVPVSVRIRSRGGAVHSFEKLIEKGTVLSPREITSVVFLLNEDELPRTASLEVFYGEEDAPLFSKSVRF